MQLFATRWMNAGVITDDNRGVTVSAQSTIITATIVRMYRRQDIRSGTTVIEYVGTHTIHRCQMFRHSFFLYRYLQGDISTRFIGTQDSYVARNQISRRACNASQRLVAGCPER